MDKSTYEIRKQYWSGIIAQCHARPEGQSAKQWLKENNIREATYYLWQRRIRQDVYGQLQSGNEADSTLPAKRSSGEIVFAELPHPLASHPAENTILNPATAATIRTGDITIDVVRDIPSDLLTVILREVLHA